MDSILSGGECAPGLGPECTEQIEGAHFVFPAPNVPCATLLAYPVLWTPDWQSVDANVNPSWKERVVHTGTLVDVTVQPNPLWLANISHDYFEEQQTQVPGAVLIAPWRSALFVYDDDEVVGSGLSGLTSLWTSGWMETERYIPGTYRQGRIYHQSSVVEWQPERVRIRTGAKRRLETGEGLYWVFEMGCVTANNAGGDISQALFTSYGGPFWLHGQFRSSYVE